MGPVIIFDKSTLEALNPDEAVWLETFFFTNITPVFFVETLADLEKEVGVGRTPESVVGNLAHKTPEMHCRPNAHHLTLLAAELSGNEELDLKNGRPLVSGGQALHLEGRTGLVFSPSPEEEALGRWQRGEFLDLERTRAKAWRAELSSTNLEESYRLFQNFVASEKPKTLGEVKRLVDWHVDDSPQDSLLPFALALLRVSPVLHDATVERWKAVGRPPLRQFAPYLAHLFSVDLFFYLALAANLIARTRPSHKIDFAYLYYLPFCMVFTSNDKLHTAVAPLFLRGNQSFVSGSDLKADLSRLDHHYSALPDELKQRGVLSFATYPPPDSTFLVTRLWDTHMSPKWRKDATRNVSQTPDPLVRRVIEELQRARREGTTVPKASSVHSDGADYLVIERKVRSKKGKWLRFPPGTSNRPVDKGDSGPD